MASRVNRKAQTVFEILADDRTTGEWLFTNRDGKPIEAITKGFAAACDRAGIEDLRSYDLRHTFATRLLERGVHHFVISALLGHSTPMTGFGYASRMTPGYAHATWDTMVTAVAAAFTTQAKQLRRGRKYAESGPSKEGWLAG